METQRLHLRQLTENDAEIVYALTSRPEVAQYMRFEQHTDPSQALSLIHEYDAFPSWLITEKESGLPVGVFACKPGETAGEYGLSTFTAPECWNKGYSTEVLSAMIPVLRQKGVQTLTAHVVADNTGSRRVLLKNGFTEWKTLVFPDLPQGLIVYRYDLTAPDTNT